MSKKTFDDINEELDDVLEEGRQLLNDAEVRERLEELKTEAELLIRKHPVKSVLIGAAAGFILAKLLRGN